MRLRRIDNYLILAQIRPFAAILAVLVSLFAGYSLAGILGDAVGALLPAAVIAELTLLKVLIALDVLIPIALFFAVLLAFGRLQSDGEASAMLALGISPLRLARPVLGVAAVVALAVAALSLFVRPWAYGRSHIVSRHAAVVTNVNAMQAGTFYASQDGSRVVFLGARSGPGAPAQGVFVARSAGDHLEVIAAGSAQPAADDGSGQHRVQLSDAHVYELNPADPTRDQVVDGATLTLDPNSAMPGAAGYSPVAASTAHLLGSRRPADVAERQWRLSTGLSTLLLAPLGMVLTRGRPRQGRYARIGTAILVYSAYYLLCTTARTWVEHGQVAALPGLWWAPAGLAAALAALWFAPMRRTPPRPAPRGAPRLARTRLDAA